MIQFIAFDLGGVLVDVQLKRLDEALQCGASVVEDAFFGENRHDAFSKGVLEPSSYLRDVAQKLNRTETETHAAWSNVVAPYHHAYAVLDAVTRPYAAWSNTDPVHIAALARALPPTLLGSQRCLSYEVHANKPDFAFFRCALARLKWAPEEILYLDDRAENVIAARSLGIIARQVDGLNETVAALHEVAVLSSSFHFPQTI